MPDHRPPIVIVSNRGPLAFRRDDDGGLVAKRGAGGLVSGLAPLVADSDATWIAAAISDADREAAAKGVMEADHLRVRLLDVEPATFGPYYDVICNATLWFAYHGLFDLARRPRIDRRWREAWVAYQRVNAAFAEAAAEAAPDGATVLVQDYHLALVPPRLRERRPDVAVVHFSHTPFCYPDGLRALPDDAAAEVLAGMAAAHACTFHCERWATAFRSCCRAVLQREPTTLVTPLAPDPSEISEVAASDACAREAERLGDELGGRRLILRVDRVELSKNIGRGFHAYDEMLDRHPEWRGGVVFGALVYPSREGLPEYLAYRQEVEGLIRQVNDHWGTPEWTPILYDASDNFPRSVAALQRSDVLLVNPIRDGMNFVAFEGPVVNQRDGVVVLSTEAGAWDLLGAAGAVGINPFDVSATADGLAAALAMGAAERHDRASTLRAAAAARTPSHWLADQAAAATTTAAAGP
ncbi:MAG: alpha,alpha-trehalose-phosphate synthase (UDP-forming) [Acidimicrobiales bacterium]